MSAELEELVRDAYALPYGRTRSALLEQVVDRAEAEGEAAAAFDHRIDLATAYIQGGEPRLVFAPFARCLADLDADPQRYAPFAARLLWTYKGVINAMTHFPEITLAQTYAALDDMARRWQAGGHSPHAVHQYRWVVAHHLGDQVAAEQHFRAWSSSERDELSDCVGCDPDDRIQHLQWVGRDDEAVTLGLATLTQTFSCVEQPQQTQTTLLTSLVAQGRLDEALDAHRRGYRALRTRAAKLSGWGAHVRFATATGNLERALEILTRHVHELVSPPHPFAAMEFQAIASRTLRELAEADPTAVVDDEHGVGSDPALLAVRYAASARDLAAQFDTRNATPHQGARIEHLLAEEHWVDRLSLLSLPTTTTTTTHAAEDAGPPPADVAVPAAEAPPELAASPTTEPEPLPDLADVGTEGLLDLVDDALRRHRPDVARQALDRFTTERPDAEQNEQERGRAAYAESELAYEDGGREESRDALRVALVHLDAAGDDLRLHRARATLGSLLAADGEIDEATATADGSLAWLVEHDELSRRGGWALQRALLDRAAGRTEQAYDGLRSLFAEGSGTVERDEHVALLLTQEELERGRYAEAAGTASRAIRSADPVRWRWARRLRADARRASGDATGALEDRLEALAGTTGVPDAATDPRLVLELAEDHLAAGHASDAVEAGETALRLAQRDPDGGRPVEDARLLLLRGYKELAETALALEQVVAIKDLMPDDVPPRFRAGVLQEQGELNAQLGRSPEAVASFLAAAAIRAAEGSAALQVRALRWALDCVGRDGDLERSAVLREEAFEASGAIPEDDSERWFHQGWLWIERAQAHLRANRTDDALGAYAHAEATFHRGGLGDLATEAVLQRAEAVGADVDELRALFVAAQERGNPWYRSGWLLADRLRTADRGVEADALEAELESAAAEGPSS